MRKLKQSALLAGFLWALVGLGGCTAKISSDGSSGGLSPGGSGDPGGLGAPGSAGGPGGPGATASSCGSVQAGPERIHRLTATEYTNTVRALLGNVALEPELDADKEPIATLDGVRKWYNAADAAVPPTTAWLSAYGSCKPDADAACAVTLYEAFAERAFRRPLNNDERTWLAESWTKFPAAATVAQKLQTIVELILQAPQFLYVYSEGAPSGAIGVLDGYERAERLAYFLWDAPPDQTLLAAASGGKLDTTVGMREQAERMLGDERAKPVLRSFLAKWLELDGATILPSLEQTPKDAKLYPGFDTVLRQSMRREIEMFMDYVMFEKDGSLDALFTGTRAYVNGPLAKIYGVTGPTTADDWSWVDLDPTKRAGMLTRAGFLAVHASQDVTSPIRRGVYMLKEVLCVDIPPPPANVDNSPIKVTAGEMAGGVTTVRQATLKRTGNPTCAACHVMINELGFAFEHYDAIGRWQETEVGTGGTIDATANLSHAGDGFDGPVDGALELSGKLAKSPAVAKCATKKWFEAALRRSPVALDACSVDTIQAKVAETSSIRELLLAMVESDAFLNVNHGE
jgi:Protein of unknown function (DUF1592)/Protein of unknown function (DUF1588)/Protein of unknown function (DUF1585)/Protein of unknown function (DUF1595)